jgi:DICT domain-containing protein
MSFVIYDTDTTRIYDASKNSTYAATEKAAKSARTRILKAKPELAGKLEIADAAHFSQFIEKQVYRKNMMSGKMYVEAYNTPSYCSPASESYWSA